MAEKISAETAAPKKRRAGGRPWPKGVSGNPKGKPKGARNHAKIEAEVFARRLLEEPDYADSLRRRVLAGTASQMEVLLWYYAAGKPADRIEGSVRLPVQIVYRTMRPHEDPLASEPAE